MRKGANGISDYFWAVVGRRVRLCPAVKAGTIAPLRRQAENDVCQLIVIALRAIGAIVPAFWAGHNRTLRMLACSSIAVEGEDTINPALNLDTVAQKLHKEEL